VPQVRELLTAVLPRQVFDPRMVLAVVRYYQRRNHLAYLAHRKRTLKRLRRRRGQPPEKTSL